MMSICSKEDTKRYNCWMEEYVHLYLIVTANLPSRKISTNLYFYPQFILGTIFLFFRKEWILQIIFAFASLMNEIDL